MKEIKKEICARYCGPRTACENAWGVRSVKRGAAMICVTATESGTDEDCEAAGRVAKVLIDHYARRPSLEDEAIRYISRQCNNSLFTPGDTQCFCRCDMASLLLLDGRVRCFISGNSRIYHFVNQKLEYMTKDSPYPLLGEKFVYTPELDPPFELREGDNAFLISSNKLSEVVAVDKMEELLSESSNAEDWLEKLVECAGQDTQFCATAVFVEPMKMSGIFGLLRRKPPKRRP